MRSEEEVEGQQEFICGMYNAHDAMFISVHHKNRTPHHTAVNQHHCTTPTVPVMSQVSPGSRLASAGSRYRDGGRLLLLGAEHRALRAASPCDTDCGRCT